jgi:alkyldihydroxyacetonephosphate synthase
VKLDGASLLLCGFEGSKDTVWAQKEFARARCRRGVSVGPSPAERYVQDRFEAPYLRDALIERRILVDTLETATVWSNLERLHRAVHGAIANALGPRSHVGCHVSHVYTEGASLYFTFFAVQRRGEELAQYDLVKAAATRAILDHGGHLSHHHGIGTEHARYWREAIGEEAFRVLRDLKRSLDPHNIMNPGKLFPVSA